MTHPSAPLGLDLLRSRRAELGQPVNPPPLRSALQLSLPAAAVGISVVVLVAVLSGVAWRRTAALEQQLDRWQTMELQTNQWRQRLQRTRDRAETLEAATTEIADRLVSIRSSSAFLEQLRRSIPEAVRLQSVAVQPAQARLQGVAQDRGATEGWQQINALLLNLEAWPAVPDDGAKLQLAKTERDQLVGFRLDLRFDPDVQPTPEQLQDLGAVGLARRLRLLRQLGLSR